MSEQNVIKLDPADHALVKEFLEQQRIVNKLKYLAQKQEGQLEWRDQVDLLFAEAQIRAIQKDFNRVAFDVLWTAQLVPAP